ncbi:SDR family oxidoreductase [Sulfitobacter mediterraneus]|uniref:SDR family oxidoreductase n=1 Tax=Sulfitobacter mediterraneus TaxID=83219 RepID=UPI00193A5AC5|nr:SDR family oxidoreductase [Sulfitobacter mediterraneus]MBM1558110.1 SDR family oxidoreductase [Sulfitobacter mediterraneus]MBM1570222.1 SDR family oxidoreductase [Sulfitobacter mediterraneus]MBM1573316.1 SDR family oxidoreductase [Sulfitobacter mediterraneus]MBM1577240.1 SDR family oxidoreductase [Sulfitobacter mediterraneus]MBM1581099.1 SDR family oxidoreductase [Sulfitobacter mediterraneus]
MTRILITGAAGAVGRALLSQLASAGEHEVIATDLAAPSDLPDGIKFAPLNVRGQDPDTVIATHQPEVVIHLASIVGHTTREFAYSVDVTGSENVIAACLKHGVRRLVVTSSGAAYGYHADNPEWLKETDALRGNAEFAYADHKRQVEEMLSQTRRDHPQLEQVILRVGTVLGAGLENQITALFHKPRLLAVTGSDSPFVFIWTQDLARILHRAATDGPAGIFNVAGDGALGIPDLAQLLGKPVLRLPPALLRLALAVAKPLKLSRYGPEQVRFLQYRPVLDNTALKTVFGYEPELSSAETFDLWRKAAGL